MGDRYAGGHIETGAPAAVWSYASRRLSAEPPCTDRVSAVTSRTPGPRTATEGMSLAAITAFLVLTSTPVDDGPPTFALGGRATGWLGGYASPGLGGRLQIRAFEDLGLQLFSDNYLREVEAGSWRDHVIGFGLYMPTLLETGDLYLAPVLGACVDFRFARSSHPDAPETGDVWFGVHAGALTELFVHRHLSVTLEAELYGYVGHESTNEAWSAEVRDTLGLQMVAQLAVGANLWL